MISSIIVLSDDRNTSNFTGDTKGKNIHKFPRKKEKNTTHVHRGLEKYPCPRHNITRASCIMQNTCVHRSM